MIFFSDSSRLVEQLRMLMQTLTILIFLVLEELWFLPLQDQPLRYLPMFPHPTPPTELPGFLQEQVHPDSQV